MIQSLTYITEMQIACKTMKLTLLDVQMTLSNRNNNNTNNNKHITLLVQ